MSDLGKTPSWVLVLWAISTLGYITSGSKVDSLEDESKNLNDKMRMELPESVSVSDTVSNAILFEQVIAARNDIIAKQDSVLKANGLDNLMAPTGP